MGFGKVLKDEILELGVLVLLIVVISVVLLKMRASDSVACNAGRLVTNESAATICCANSNCSVNVSVRALYNDVGTYVTAFSEPKNWVIIIIIGLVAVGLIALFMKLSKNRK